MKNDFQLRPGQVVTLSLRQPKTRVTCQRGNVWVTLEGQDQDHLLHGGENYICPQKGKLVIQAFSGASVRLLTDSKLGLVRRAQLLIHNWIQKRPGTQAA
jgi:hypothetical protein